MSRVEGGAQMRLLLLPESIPWLGSFIVEPAGGRTSRVDTYTIHACSLSSPPKRYSSCAPILGSRCWHEGSSIEHKSTYFSCNCLDSFSHAWPVFAIHRLFGRSSGIEMQFLTGL